MGNRVEKEELTKKLVVYADKEHKIVTNYDEMLRLLDHDWEVKEEYSGDMFIMNKKKPKT
jgi:GTPase